MEDEKAKEEDVVQLKKKSQSDGPPWRYRATCRCDRNQLKSSIVCNCHNGGNGCPLYIWNQKLSHVWQPIVCFIWGPLILSFHHIGVWAFKMVKATDTTNMESDQLKDLPDNADLPLNWIEKSGSDQQKIGIWGKKSGSWSNRLQKEITHPKSQLFVVSFFYSAIRNVLNCLTSSYVFFSCLFCLCVCFFFYVCSLRPANS